MAFPANVNLSRLNGNNGFSLKRDAYDESSIAVGGDINGNGIDDIVISQVAPDNYSAEVFVVFGSGDGFGKTLDKTKLSTQIDGTNGFMVSGLNEAGIYGGAIISIVGDVNGDGKDDLQVSDATPFSEGRRAEYIVFGSSNGAASIDIGDFDNTKGGVITGRDGGFISSAGRAGDINGDGIDNVIFEVPSYRRTYDGSYVVFGSRSGFDPTLNLLSLQGDKGFASTQSITPIGDFNGDGIDDIAHRPSIVFGADSGFDESPAALNGQDGFSFDAEGGDLFVRAAGDINADGIDDLLISSNSRDHIVFGRHQNTPPPKPNQPRLKQPQGTNRNDILTGNSQDNTLNGRAGNDRLLGLNGNDTLIGGESNDNLLGQKGNDRLLGGNGSDTLNGGQVSDTLIGGNGDDLLDGGRGRDLLIGGNGKDTFVINASGGNNTIQDFQAQDRIGLSGGLKQKNLTFSGNAILLGDTGKVIATLNGVATATLSNDRFVVVT